MRGGERRGERELGEVEEELDRLEPADQARARCRCRRARRGRSRRRWRTRGRRRTAGRRARRSARCGGSGRGRRRARRPAKPSATAHHGRCGSACGGGAVGEQRPGARGQDGQRDARRPRRAARAGSAAGARQGRRLVHRLVIGAPLGFLTCRRTIASAWHGSSAWTTRDTRRWRNGRPPIRHAVEAPWRRCASELEQGLLRGRQRTGEGQAEQVSTLPLDADLVILRRPIAGG